MKDEMIKSYAVNGVMQYKGFHIRLSSHIWGRENCTDCPNSLCLRRLHLMCSPNAHNVADSINLKSIKSD